MIIGRFFIDALVRGKTWFGITNKRLIISKGLFFQQTVSYDYVSLANLNCVERSDQSGDILFGAPSPYGQFSGSTTFNNRRYQQPGFYLLPQVRQAYQIIQEAMKADRASQKS